MTGAIHLKHPAGRIGILYFDEGKMANCSELDASALTLGDVLQQLGMATHQQIERAFEQYNAGQHEAALQSMANLVREHSGNPEAWGRQAQLLAFSGQVEEAEQALQKAFDLNPNYPFGFMLRGTFRQQEGELVGALMLFRKAAEAYAADAHDPLSYIQELIADLELRLNRPVAARAALKQALHFQPSNAEIRATRWSSLKMQWPAPYGAPVVGE